MRWSVSAGAGGRSLSVGRSMSGRVSHVSVSVRTVWAGQSVWRVAQAGCGTVLSVSVYVLAHYHAKLAWSIIRHHAPVNQACRYRIFMLFKERREVIQSQLSVGNILSSLSLDVSSSLFYSSS